MKAVFRLFAYFGILVAFICAPFFVPYLYFASTYRGRISEFEFFGLMFGAVVTFMLSMGWFLFVAGVLLPGVFLQ